MTEDVRRQAILIERHVTYRKERQCPCPCRRAVIGAGCASQYRWGRGDMQIHAALREPLRWRDSRLDDVLLVHVTPGLNGVRKAVGEPNRSVLPVRPTIAAGQRRPTTS